MILAGDNGGTKTELALFAPGGDPRQPQAHAEFPSAQYPSLEAIVQAFLASAGVPPAGVERACIAVAGPVIAGRAKITNLTWTVELDRLQAALPQTDLSLINDLQAVALAVPILTAAELAPLNVGQALPGGGIAVIAPGTGLGMAFLTGHGTAYEAHASEGGHADFAPGNAIEQGLLTALQARFGHVSVERVCSGHGLPNIYEYLRAHGEIPESPAVAAALAGAADPAPVIVDHALHPTAPCPLCAATLDLFIGIFGGAAGNLALTVLATGGVYLAGGIPPRMLPTLQNGRFMAAFLRKGRLADMLANLPVHVILSRAALLGAAHAALTPRGMPAPGG